MAGLGTREVRRGGCGHQCRRGCTHLTDWPALASRSPRRLALLGSGCCCCACLRACGHSLGACHRRLQRCAPAEPACRHAGQGCAGRPHRAWASDCQCLDWLSAGAWPLSWASPRTWPPAEHLARSTIRPASHADHPGGLRLRMRYQQPRAWGSISCPQMSAACRRGPAGRPPGGPAARADASSLGSAARRGLPQQALRRSAGLTGKWQPPCSRRLGSAAALPRPRNSCLLPVLCPFLAGRTWHTRDSRSFRGPLVGPARVACNRAAWRARASPLPILSWASAGQTRRAPQSGRSRAARPRASQQGPPHAARRSQAAPGQTRAPPSSPMSTDTTPAGTPAP